MAETNARPPQVVRLTPGKRVLFLTKDPELIRRQLRGELDLRADAAGPAWRPARRHQHRRDDAGVGLLQPQAGGPRAGGVRGADRRGEAHLRARRALRRQFRGDRLGLPQRCRQLARDGGAGREVERHPDRDRGVVRADPRGEQHQSGRPHGRLRRSSPAPAGGGDPARGVLPRLRSDHAADRAARGDVPVREGARGGRGRAPAPGDAAAPDEHDGEGPRLEDARRDGRAVGGAGRRDPGERRRRLLARVHDRPGPLLSRAGVRRGLRREEPAEVRRLRGSPHLRGRRREDAPVHGQDPGPARSAARVSASTRACATSRRRAASLPASATRSRASSSSIRAISSRRPTATPAWEGSTTRSRGASAPPSTPTSCTPGSRRWRSPRRSGSSWRERSRRP